MKLMYIVEFTILHLTIIDMCLVVVVAAVFSNAYYFDFLFMDIGVGTREQLDQGSSSSPNKIIGGATSTSCCPIFSVTYS